MDAASPLATETSQYHPSWQLTTTNTVSYEACVDQPITPTNTPTALISAALLTSPIDNYGSDTDHNVGVTAASLLSVFHESFRLQAETGDLVAAFQGFDALTHVRRGEPWSGFVGGSDRNCSTASAAGE